MNYYPYHLDKNCDEENGKHYDFGFGDDEDEEDEWCRK